MSYYLNYPYNNPPIDKGETYHHYFINNTYASLFRSLADYFRTEWFKRDCDVIISTYSKAVRHWKNVKKNAGENYSPRYPLLSMDVMTDLEPDPQAGRFLYQYPNFAKRRQTDLFGTQTEPKIYEDDHILITPIWNRYKGRINLTIWCRSIYEYFDIRTLTYQLFGGSDRVIKPTVVDGYIVLPDEVVDWTYNNEYTNENYNLNWEDNKADVKLIKNMNKNKMCFPFSIIPQIKLAGVGDAADKYGGAGEDIAQHRLEIEMEWESYLPVHVGIHSLTGRPLPKNKCFITEMILSHRNVKNQKDYEEPIVIDSVDSSLVLYGNKDLDTFYSGIMKFKEEFNYQLSELEIEKINSDPQENFQIELLEDVEIEGLGVRIYGKFGELIHGKDWRFINKSLIEFYSKEMTKYDTGDVLNFVIYDTSDLKKIQNG
jgi:hypothetical protein